MPNPPLLIVLPYYSPLSNTYSMLIKVNRSFWLVVRVIMTWLIVSVRVKLSVIVGGSLLVRVILVVSHIVFCTIEIIYLSI